MSGDKDKKDRGAKIMQNFKKQVVAHDNLKDILSESKKSTIFINGFEVKGQQRKSKWITDSSILYIYYLCTTVDDECQPAIR